MASDFIAGCIGGCAGILVGHPFDTIKCKIQVQDLRHPLYKNGIDCFRKTIRHESVAGLFKGVSSPLCGVSVINALVFGIYGNLQKNLPYSESLFSHFVAGTVAGVVQSFICSPLELAKTQIQIQKFQTFKNPLHCLLSIWKKEGMKGIFRGLNMTILREGLGFGIYFAVYEQLTKSPDPTSVSALKIIIAGGCSGAACWLCSYPMDVIKSRLQADGISGKKLYKNSLDCLKKSANSEGVSFLFRGLTPTIVRAFPVNATTWVVFVWLKEIIKTETNSKSHSEALHKNFFQDFNNNNFHLHNTRLNYNCSFEEKY